MFFNKRGVEVPAWLIELDRKQRVFARKLADYLERKTAKMPAGRLKLFAAIVLWLMMGVNIFLMISSSKEGGLPPFRWPEELILQRPNYPVIREDFHRYVDRLRENQVFDSLLKVRPGLKDTLKFLEELSETGH